MSKGEEENRGTLTIDVEYIKFAQKLNNVIYMCQRLKDELDITAINKNMINRDRRKEDRRNAQNNSSDSNS